jgi:plastocyanin
MGPPCRLAGVIAVAAGLLTTVARAGSITGVVSAKGPDVARAAAGGEYGSRRFSLAERVDYAHLDNFVIYVDQVVPGASAPQGTETITQHDVSFEPHVLPVALGQRVRWPNGDAVYHNVYSTSESKEFDLGLYLQERVPELVFDQLGRVDVFCSIHAKMHCIVLVLPSPYFAVSGPKGRFSIRNVPPGTYRVRAWQERMPPSAARLVTVPAAGDAKGTDFVLGLGGLPKY